MAGQPPEPSFQPAGQDQNLTQGRPAWQPAAYPPPAPGSGQPGYSPPAYTPADQGYPPQDQGYPAPDQGYAQPDQGYAAQEQTYTSVPQGGSQAQAQPQGQDYQGYQGYQPPSYGAGQGQQQDQRTAPPQWQGIAGVTPAPAKPPKQQHGERGFLGSLFDFSFSTFVTPKIIKVLYILVTIWTLLIALLIAVIGFRTGGAFGGIVVLIVVEPVFILLTLGVYRVVLEAFMVVFRIYEETKQIRENTTKES